MSWATQGTVMSWVIQGKINRHFVGLHTLQVTSTSRRIERQTDRQTDRQTTRMDRRIDSLIDLTFDEERERGDRGRDCAVTWPVSRSKVTKHRQRNHWDTACKVRSSRGGGKTGDGSVRETLDIVSFSSACVSRVCDA